MTGLYVHVPFCVRACPYCDFDFVVGRTVDAPAYLGALADEVRQRALGGARMQTVYVGGGTPSALGPDALTALLGWVRATFDVAGDAEVTVEVNPEHVDAALCDALCEAGCTRLSVGLQSADAGALVQLGRAHDVEAGLRALERGVAAGLAVSADLIVGWPGQRPAAALHDVAAVLGTGAAHVSIYALSIEPNTPWVKLVGRGTRAMPDEDEQTDALLAAESRLLAAGWAHYEVASYARDGARARHNLGYWTWRDYVGLGPSAASACYQADGSVERRTNPRGLQVWRDQARAGSLRAEVERLEGDAAAAEGIFVGLRVLTGLDVGAYLARFAVDRAWLAARVAAEVARGNLVFEGPGRLRVADGRWLWYDEICAALLRPPRRG